MLFLHRKCFRLFHRLGQSRRAQPCGQLYTGIFLLHQIVDNGSACCSYDYFSHIYLLVLAHS